MKPLSDWEGAFFEKSEIMFNKNNKELIRKKYNIIKSFSTKMPVIDGIVFNPATKQDRGETERFLIDTGAEVNILSGDYEDLLKK